MDNINQSISVLYCFNAPDGDKGRLEKIKLRKSINQLRMMAGLAGVELELYVMSLEKDDAPDRCKWIDASYVDGLCRKYFKFAPIRPYSGLWWMFAPFLPQFDGVQRVLCLDPGSCCVDKRFFDIVKLDFNGRDCIAVRDAVRRSSRSADLKSRLGDTLSEIQNENFGKDLYMNTGAVMFDVSAVRRRFASAEKMAETARNTCRGAYLADFERDLPNVVFEAQFVPYRYCLDACVETAGLDCAKYMLCFGEWPDETQIAAFGRGLVYTRRRRDPIQVKDLFAHGVTPAGMSMDLTGIFGADEFSSIMHRLTDQDLCEFLRVFPSSGDTQTDTLKLAVWYAETHNWPYVLAFCTNSAPVESAEQRLKEAILEMNIYVGPDESAADVFALGGSGDKDGFRRVAEPIDFGVQPFFIRRRAYCRILFGLEQPINQLVSEKPMFIISGYGN